MQLRYIEKRLEILEKDTIWLADQVGVSHSTMKQNYMRGLIPSKAVAISIARVLGCELSDVLTKEEMDRLSIKDEAS